jgi:hypothetical protein
MLSELFFEREHDLMWQGKMDRENCLTGNGHQDRKEKGKDRDLKRDRDIEIGGSDR